MDEEIVLNTYSEEGFLKKYGLMIKYTILSMILLSAIYFYETIYGFDLRALKETIVPIIMFVFCFIIHTDMMKTILYNAYKIVSKRSTLIIINIMLIISCFYFMGVADQTKNNKISYHSNYTQFRAVMTDEAIISETTLRLEEDSGLENYSFGSLIKSVSKVYGLDPYLIVAQYICESGFNKNAISCDGAKGIGQLMPCVYKKYDIDPFNPVENIVVSIKYKSQLKAIFSGISDRETQEKLCILAYSAGPGAVENAIRKAGSTNIDVIRSILPQESNLYLDQVWKYYSGLKARYRLASDI